MHESPIFARGIEVIDENAHAHATLGRQAHVLQQEPRGIVLLNDVVLDVEGAFGMIRKRNEVG